MSLLSRCVPVTHLAHIVLRRRCTTALSPANALRFTQYRSSSKKGVVSAKELPFKTGTTASPNSRLLALSGEDAGAARPGLGRTRSNASISSNKSANGGSASKKAPVVDSDSESASSEEEDDEESEEEEEEEPAPKPVKRSTSNASQKDAKSNKSNGGVLAAATGAAAAAGAAAVSVLPGSKRTESPTQDDDDSVEEYGSLDSESEESEEEDEDEYAPPRRSGGSSAAAAAAATPSKGKSGRARAATVPDGVEGERGGKKERRKMSRAATIAQETMNKDINLRHKKGKPLDTLKAEDVALTDKDIDEVRSRAWLEPA